MKNLGLTINMIFEDRRWTGARNYVISKIGNENNFTMLSGLIITFICPIIFITQNIIFGFVVNIFNYNCSNFQRIFRKIFIGVRNQTVIISDAAKFQVISSDDQKCKILGYGV